MNETLEKKQAELKWKREKLEKLEAEVQQLQHEEYVVRQDAAHERRMGLSFIDADPQYRGDAPYILPLGTEYAKINPLDPETFPFGGSDWTRYSVVYILSKPERTRPTRLIMSGGGGGNDDWDIGNTWTCRHDQTGAKLGDYTVVGVVLYDGEGNVARVIGEVPSAKLAGAVFK